MTGALEISSFTDSESISAARPSVSSAQLSIGSSDSDSCVPPHVPYIGRNLNVLLVRDVEASRDGPAVVECAKPAANQKANRLGQEPVMGGTEKAECQDKGKKPQAACDPEPPRSQTPEDKPGHPDRKHDHKSDRDSQNVRKVPRRIVERFSGRNHGGCTAIF
jgi:hypothetical protein